VVEEEEEEEEGESEVLTTEAWKCDPHYGKRPSTLHQEYTSTQIEQNR